MVLVATPMKKPFPWRRFGKVKVISIEYSHMPLHPYPAANNDITTVYKALLESYEPKHIGLYGSEAGGILAAQAMAHFKQAGLPVPGALGLCGAGAMPAVGGDSVKINAAVTAIPPANTPTLPTPTQATRWCAPCNPMRCWPVFRPLCCSAKCVILGLSSVVYTHQQLVRVGVEADLHVWEGPGGWHLYHPPLAESGEAFQVMARFFDKQLAR